MIIIMADIHEAPVVGYDILTGDTTTNYEKPAVYIFFNTKPITHSSWAI